MGCKWGAIMVAYWAGLKLALGLIMAIGAQNAFVLRQGLQREHVLAVVLFCAASDAVLIVLGVTGFARISALAPGFGQAMLWGGVAFLVWYGARAFLSAWRGGGALAAARGGGASLGATLGMLAVITWANPHVWLDTVVLLGAISAQFPGQGAAFAAGAVSASFTFFFALGFGARGLAPFFARPWAWRAVDGVIGVMMWSIAWRLAQGALQGATA